MLSQQRRERSSFCLIAWKLHVLLIKVVCLQFAKKKVAQEAEEVAVKKKLAPLQQYRVWDSSNHIEISAPNNIRLQ